MRRGGEGPLLPWDSLCNGFYDWLKMRCPCRVAVNMKGGRECEVGNVKYAVEPPPPLVLLFVEPVVSESSCLGSCRCWIRDKVSVSLDSFLVD